jgi:hypothetical protein
MDVELSLKQDSIATVVFKVNMLQPYPLGVLQIEDWAIAIDTIVPNLDIQELKEVIYQYMIGGLNWDSTKGIQNILQQLDAVKRELRKKKIF